MGCFYSEKFKKVKTLLLINQRILKKMTFFAKQFLSIGFLMTALFFYRNISANEIQSSIPDSLKTKSPKQIVASIKRSNLRESKVYESVLNTISDSDLILAQQYYDIASFFYNKEEYERSAYYLNKSSKLAKKKRTIRFYLNVI